MQTIQPKKLVILYILDILLKYTDEEHTLTQNEILQKLKREYNMTVDRKSVRRNLMNLAAQDELKIYYKEITRSSTTKRGADDENEQETIFTDWYIVHDFEQGELQVLIDSVLFSPYISENEGREIAEKLAALSSVYFKPNLKHGAVSPVGKTDNRQVFFVIEELTKAISEGKKVSFNYCEYTADKKLRKRKDANGKDRLYICSPYQLAVSDGKYFLICNYDKYSDISNYRIDRIKDIKILDEKAKPFESLTDSNGKRLDLKEYMKEHIFMFTGESVYARFTVPKENSFLTDIIDKFGKDISIIDRADKYEIGVRVNKDAMHQYAKQYMPYLTVLSPQSLVEDIKKDLQEAMGNYSLK